MRPGLFLAAWAAATALFWAAPEIDLLVSGWFHTPGEGFRLARLQPFRAIHDAVAIVTWTVVAGAALLTLVRRRAGLFVLASYAIGPGLLANVILKGLWGRARPSQIAEFGGTKLFTPAPLPADQCLSNCSFVAGDGAAGFALLAVALLAPRHRGWAIAAALLAGAVFALNRVAMGAHFLSDAVHAGFLVTATVWLLHKPWWAGLQPLNSSGTLHLPTQEGVLHGRREA